jgi:hypothetical protein
MVVIHLEVLVVLAALEAAVLVLKLVISHLLVVQLIKHNNQEIQEI